MSHSTAAFWITLLVAGTAANDIWRFTGTWLSRGVDPSGPLMTWVKDVSTALVAALIVRLLILPTGEFAAVKGAVRYTAFAAGIAAYILSRKSLAAGLVAAEVAFFLTDWALAA
jgi:hypothetical protein